MARSDQSQMAILGALSITPLTGYALREEIRDSLGHFWSESFGQIYPALAELERTGLVERTEGTDSRSTPYGITAAGRARLRELLAEPPQQTRPRNGLLLRLFFGGELAPELRVHMVTEAREEAQARLAQLAIARRDVEGDPRLEHSARFILLTISAGEHSARATIDWADEALAELASLGD